MAGIADEFAKSKGSLAKSLGVSERYVSELIEAGMPGKGAKGYPVAKCQAWLAAKRAPKEKPLASYDERMAAAELDKLEAQARKERLKTDQLEGKLIDRDEAFRWACMLCAVIGTRLDQMPEEVTTELPPDIRQAMKERMIEKLDLIRQTMANERLPGIDKAVFVMP